MTHLLAAQTLDIDSKSHHKSLYAEPEAACSWRFGAWLPDSGEEAANSTFEFYLNDCKSPPPAGWLTDICQPLIER